ncbi:MAG: protein kinase [Planctomycetia bacterium]|nr:protein kinase [Planctomycetia bacterium]
MDHTILQNVDDQKRAQQLSLAGDKEKPPTHVAGLEMHKCLGEGAFGEVWLATEVNTGVKVAVKFYTRRGGHDWSLLPREVEKLAVLANDRHVVQLRQVGWDSEPPFYVMEYVEEGSLEDRLRDGPLDVETAVELFREVAVGLAHAHGKGILHCDLKPGNVLVDQDNRPRLCDFGQSRLTNELTHALGTLFYMAPEQAETNAAPDVRWDVYALGALLYCMLTGQAPYRTDEAVKRLEGAPTLDDRLTTYQRIIREAPRPTEHRRAPGMDKRLADVVDRCLEVEPSRRFPNVQAVLTALDARARQRARRPLLVLATLGPILFLVVTAFVMTRGFLTAIDQQKATLREKSMAGNVFAARFVGQAVGAEITRRWEALEQEAADPELLKMMADYYKAQTAGNHAETAKVQDQIEAWLERARLRYENARRGSPDEAKAKEGIGKSASWFVNEVDGTQLGRHPTGSARDKNYSHRDYFHGQGVDHLPGTPGLKPIRGPHLSIAFVSTSTGKPIVGFSVPIFAEGADRTQDDPIGVLAMTVELGRFTEIQWQQNQLVSLVDSKPDTKVNTCTITTPWPGASHEDVNRDLTSVIETALKDLGGAQVRGQSTAGRSVVTVDVAPEIAARGGTWKEVQTRLDSLAGKLPAQAEKPTMTGRRGAVLEHPGLPEQQQSQQKNGAPASLFYVNDQTLPLLESACDPQNAAAEPLKIPVYADPVGAAGNVTFSGNWLAAMVPVRAVHTGQSYPTGWAVIVQEQESQAVKPVQNLSGQLLQQAIIGVVLLVLTVLVLWGFVAVLLKGTPRSRFLRTLRRGLGLTTPSATSASARLGRTPLTSRNSVDVTRADGSP